MDTSCHTYFIMDIINLVASLKITYIEVPSTPFVNFKKEKSDALCQLWSLILWDPNLKKQKLLSSVHSNIRKWLSLRINSSHWCSIRSWTAQVLNKYFMNYLTFQHFIFFSILLAEYFEVSYFTTTIWFFSLRIIKYHRDQDLTGHSEKVYL